MARRIRGTVATTLACGVALGVAGVAAVDVADQRADAQTAKFEVTPAQLQINQRISQAAVRRSNEGLNLLGPVRPKGSTDEKPISPFPASTRGKGWPTLALGDKAVTSAKVADAGITTPKLADDAVTNSKMAHPTYQAVITADGTFVRGTASSSSRTADPGRYQVIFPVDVSACAMVAQQGGPSTTLGPGSIGFAAAAGVGGNPNAVQVATWDSTTALANRDFHLTVTC